MLDDANTLLILAVIPVAGTISGAITRRFHLASVTGQILAGVIVGASVLRVLDEQFEGWNYYLDEEQSESSDTL